MRVEELRPGSFQDLRCGAATVTAFLSRPAVVPLSMPGRGPGGVRCSEKLVTRVFSMDLPKEELLEVGWSCMEEDLPFRLPFMMQYRQFDQRRSTHGWSERRKRRTDRCTAGSERKGEREREKDCNSELNSLNREW